MVDPSMRHNTLFNDVHSLLHNVTVDLEHFRKVAEENDDARQQEIEELRRKLDHEKYEHREQVNKFRYEFDELVHLKVEKIIETIENMHRNEKKDDRSQQQQIDRIAIELKKLKKNVRDIASKWDRFAKRPRTPLSATRLPTKGGAKA